MDASMKMHTYVRELSADSTRKGQVVPLTDIWLSVQAVPVFGKKCPSEWTCHSAVELAKELRLNVFDCHATYMLVY